MIFAENSSDSFLSARIMILSLLQLIFYDKYNLTTCLKIKLLSLQFIIYLTI